MEFTITKKENQIHYSLQLKVLTDGHEYRWCYKLGAKAVLVEDKINVDSSISVIKVENSRKAMSK